MRRAIVTAGVLLAGLTALLVATTSHPDRRPQYAVELDNAFGIIPGSDLKIAGVRAGVVTGVHLDRRTARAIAGIRVDATGYGGFHTDAHCTVRLQSLLGEYFLDCDPGSPDHPPLAPHGRIPVAQTQSTVAPDLVLTTMRLPYRERLRLIVNELGAGVAGNAEQLNAALARAVPAMTQTDAVLRSLATQRRDIARLIADAHTVVGALSARRADVGRFVDGARNVAVVSARRRSELGDALHQLPVMLRRLTPAMADLDAIARRGTPVARNLDASAARLTALLHDVTSLSDASRPALGALGDAAVQGRAAMHDLAPEARRLQAMAEGLPEMSTNLSIVLRALADRDHAVERNPASPGGKGFSALENFMNYIYEQVLAINIYDADNHILKGGVFANDCSPYMNAQAAKANPALVAKCRSWLGPNQPGVTTRDPTAPAARGTPQPGAPRRTRPRNPLLPAPAQTLGTLPARPTTAVPLPSVSAAAGQAQDAVQGVLDYLLRP